MGGDVVSLGRALTSLLLRTGLIALAVGLVLTAVLLVGFRRRAGMAGRPDGPEPTERTEQSGPGEEPAEPRARRFLRLSLAGLWIVDGLLQAQPLMPAGFVPDNIAPHTADEPGWLRSVVDVLANAWTRHPVSADVAVIWLQIGLGLLLLLGRSGRLSRVAAWCTIAAGLAVWVLGEGMGGLFSNGAGWLTGAPGAVLVYVAAAVLLLLPWASWTDGRAPCAVRRFVSAWLLVAAALQAIPAEGFWTGSGLAAPFADGASTPQPSWLNAPMGTLAGWSAEQPVLVNIVVIALAVAAAGWLEFDRSGRPVVAGLFLCGATWWLAQDFGVFGGTATDPDTALALGLLLAAALPYWQAQVAPSRRRAAPAAALRQGAIVLAFLLTVAVPVALAVRVTGPADASALAADSQGGLRSVPPRPVPAFSLVDQNGQRVTSAGLRGKIVLITFLDPVCTSECPLIANQLATVDRRLGALAHRVEIVAIDTNPMFHNVADVAAFTRAHGLGGMPNWHFLCGEVAYSQGLLAEFGMAIDVPTVGMLAHSEGVVFASADGREAAYIDDGASEQLTGTYAQAIEHEVRELAQ